MNDTSHATFRTALHGACAAIDVSPADEQIDRLAEHFRLMVEANRRFNLTRITEPEEAAVKHYADSLSAVAWADEHAEGIGKVLDVGTGAGLPAVALAVARPEWQVTAIDGNAKKTRFVADCAEALGLTNLTALQQHTSQWHGRRDRFDLITLRAVGKLADCITQSRPLLAPGGTIVCYKSRRITDDELADGATAAKRAKLTPLPPWPYDLPLGNDEVRHTLLTYRREAPAV